jgi:predicted peptidase
MAQSIHIQRIIAATIIGITIFSFLAFSEEGKTPEPKAKNQGLSSDEKKEAEKIIKEYFSQNDESKKQKLFEELAKYDDRVSKKDLEYFAKTILPLMKKGLKYDGKNEGKCSHPDYPGEYIITVPTAAKNGAKTGLCIVLHGGGDDSGDGRKAQAVMGCPNPKLITVYPTVIKKENTAWNTEREERYVMEIINDMKQMFNIDTNQVYLTGYSMGGYGTWSIGTAHADLFAAISPMEGALNSYTGTLANLKNTPIWIFHGAKDMAVLPDSDRKSAETLEEFKKKYGPYDYVYDEDKNTGHTKPTDLPTIWKWMFARKRNPLPKFVIWEPSRSFKNNFYWLKIANPSRGIRIEAKIEGNKISLQSHVSGLTIFLNDKMIDLTKPVIIEAAGKEEFNGLTGYSLSALLETIIDKNDPEMYFTSRIELK